VSVDLQSLHKIIKHPIRRRVVLKLLEKKELSYMDLMNLVEVDNTGKLNYHLKILGDLIEKSGDGRYRLAEKGQLASQLLLRFPEKQADQMHLGGGDAVLIGFTGLLIALLNPGLWSILLVNWVGVGILYFGAILSLLYALMVPGGAVWWLTVRRTNSHDLYDLFKPPLVTFAISILLLVCMILLNVRLVISTPVQDSGNIEVVLPSLPMLILSGVLSFLGVAISEIIHRVLEKKTIL
jgi:hypothetical protein